MKPNTKMGIIISLTLSSLSVLTACLSVQTTPTQLIDQAALQHPTPTWLQQIMHEAETQPHQTQAIYSVAHQNQTYYMVVPGCCDRFSILYDTQGQTICAPSGGFTGRGDGKCGNIDPRLLPKTRIWPKKSAE